MRPHRAANTRPLLRRRPRRPAPRVQRCGSTGRYFPDALITTVLTERIGTPSLVAGSYRHARAAATTAASYAGFTDRVTTTLSTVPRSLMITSISLVSRSRRARSSNSGGTAGGGCETTTGAVIRTAAFADGGGDA